MRWRRAVTGRSGPCCAVARERRRWRGSATSWRWADYATPHQFLETILSGPLQGRRKLIERLGPEARDPIEELLSSAIEFEANGAPTLQRFLDWFARGDVEIVRDPSAPLDAVRVMTVHGSKGLQSPVLILADACVDPERQRGSSARLRLEEGGPAIPVFRPRKAELAEPLKSQIEAQEKRDREEHWRLLYVALTRAEERLYVGGALGPADRGTPPQASWYAAVAKAMEGLAPIGATIRSGDNLAGSAPPRSTARRRRAPRCPPPTCRRGCSSPPRSKRARRGRSRRLLRPRTTAPIHRPARRCAPPPSGANCCIACSSGCPASRSASAKAWPMPGYCDRQGSTMQASGAIWSRPPARSSIIPISPGCSARTRWPRRRSPR